MHRAFTPAHRGGAGSPLVCLHGFMETWRTWELVLPALERRHDVLAPTLPGHAGGPALDGPPTGHLMADAVERAMDDAGFDTAHVVGSSLGGFVALQLAARGRARTVVAFAPAGGWARDDPLLARGARDAGATARAGQGDGAARAGDRRHRRGPAPGDAARRLELRAHPGRAHRPPDARARRARSGAPALIEHGLREGYDELDAQAIACPVRIVWGTADRLLPWPSAAARFRHEWLPHADWVELEGVGHCPQLDVPLEAAQLILGFTAD